MCRITDDPLQLCPLCYQGGACWTSIRRHHRKDAEGGPEPEEAQPLVQPSQERTNPWDARWLEPAYLPYWTLSGDYQSPSSDHPPALRARARVAHAREDSN